MAATAAANASAPAKASGAATSGCSSSPPRIPPSIPSAIASPLFYFRGMFVHAPRLGNQAVWRRGMAAVGRAFGGAVLPHLAGQSPSRTVLSVIGASRSTADDRDRLLTGNLPRY